ncbi:MAG: hypothetical protein ACI8W8_001770 [Rhodothermales bacterium]|jgi:hypothetical protein
MRIVVFILWAAIAAAAPSPISDRLQATVDDALVALAEEGRWPVASWLRLQVPGENEKPAVGQRFASEVDIEVLADCSRCWPFALTGAADELRAHRDGRLCSKTALFDGRRWRALDPPADLTQFRWLPGGVMYRAGEQVVVFPPGSANPDDGLAKTTPSDDPIPLASLGYQASAPCKLYVHGELQVYDSLDTLWLRRVADSATAPSLGVVLNIDMSVAEILADSPAAQAGLTADDVLHSLDDHTLLIPADLWGRLADRQPGDHVRLRVDGPTPRTLTVSLGPRLPLFPPLSPARELGLLVNSGGRVAVDAAWIAEGATPQGAASLLEAMSRTQTTLPCATALIDRPRARGGDHAWAAAGLALGLHVIGDIEAAEDAHEHGLGLPNYGSRLQTERFAFHGARHRWQQLRDDLQLPETRATLDATGLADQLPALILNKLLLAMIEADHFPPGASAMITRLHALAHSQPWYLDTVAWSLAMTGQAEAGDTIFKNQILPLLADTKVDATLRESYARYQKK